MKPIMIEINWLDDHVHISIVIFFVNYGWFLYESNFSSHFIRHCILAKLNALIWQLTNTEHRCKIVSIE